MGGEGGSLRQGDAVPRSKGVRPWRAARTKRSSAAVHSPALRKSWDDKMADRARRKVLVETVREMKQTENEQRREEKARREATRKRREENELKSQKVQAIRNPSKIRKMSKKQLRHITTQ
mmetsp:Transcript_15512/g.31385  ORF Transcript_15512/g.31385 Transcript_15512/m.31385 type:complete len:120 (+) Transcript_15512:2120-2479(+)